MSEGRGSNPWSGNINNTMPSKEKPTEYDSFTYSSIAKLHLVHYDDNTILLFTVSEYGTISCYKRDGRDFFVKQDPDLPFNASHVSSVVFKNKLMLFYAEHDTNKLFMLPYGSNSSDAEAAVTSPHSIMKSSKSTAYSTWST